MRKVLFANNQIYHIFNRGTEKRRIFISNKDFERFLINMKIFNDPDVGQHHLGRFDIKHPKLSKPLEDPLVDVLCYCLMPNHYHLLLRQKVENGISKYLHRLQMGYAKYFNTLHDRSGNLFQGAFKVVEINKGNQFKYIPLYIHMNPLDLVEGGWKENGIKDLKKGLNFLKNYRWSSLRNYMGEKRTAYLNANIISELYDPSDWEEEIKSFLNSSNVRHRVSDIVGDIYE
ncbi:MAG: Transposase [Candidatus Giovannonibacteria bacterium GW2011_GWA2_44_26]|uniref:Transposase n=1 Tax=Candidatus Giovannonibacteria bacterium GW2011_GWA2_44_26 TaxID=1618648 RepID=A0A0G1ISF9_9BACT|nr:MAG: Transposase [Candidatus Giovannonibacteria bacterium GW2011_GWA2_44_26]